MVQSRVFPIRFTYDWGTSAPGDSGALVLADPCGEPLGMHQGEVVAKSLGGGWAAYALCLYQLEDFGGLEVWL